MFLVSLRTISRSGSQFQYDHHRCAGGCHTGGGLLLLLLLLGLKKRPHAVSPSPQQHETGPKLPSYNALSPRRRVGHNAANGPTPDSETRSTISWPFLFNAGCFQFAEMEAAQETTV
jgi:hypothetical protein